MAKESRGFRQILAGVVTLFSAFIATTGQAAAGRTVGSFDVSNGAASYSIPIFTPPGPHGMQPSVALTYNSNSRGGVLGRGWALSGQHSSSIRLCPKTIAQDGWNGYMHSACLDGNRLRVQSGSTYWGNGSVYKTEIADFSRITASNPSGQVASWTVERKDGLTYTYGGSSDSRVGDPYPIEWKLREIHDRAGNKVRFTWKTADSTTSGTTHLVKIEWTQTSAGSGSYVYSMDLIYSAGGNAPSSSYFHGTLELPRFRGQVSVLVP